MREMTPVGTVAGHPLDWNALILAGGRASRLGGIDKTALRYRGRTLLEHAIDSAATARSIAVVAPSRPPLRGSRVRFVADARGGPAAAVAAGLDALGDHHHAWTALLAADQPRITEALPAVLGARRVFAGADGIAPRDRSARMQTLLAVYSTTALLEAVAAARRRGTLFGLPLRDLLVPLTLCAVLLSPELSADVDTAADAHAFGITLPPSHLRALSAG